MEGFKDFKMTEEKVQKLLPIVEKNWSRKYGVDLKLDNLTFGGVTVWRDEFKIKSCCENTNENEQDKI